MAINGTQPFLVLIWNKGESLEESCLSNSMVLKLGQDIIVAFEVLEVEPPVPYQLFAYFSHMSLLCGPQDYPI